MLNLYLHDLFHAQGPEQSGPNSQDAIQVSSGWFPLSFRGTMQALGCDHTLGPTVVMDAA